MGLRLLELLMGGDVGAGTFETIMLVACWSDINIGEIKTFRVGMSFIVGLVDMVSLKLQHLLASTEWRNQSDVVFDHVVSHVAIRAVIVAENNIGLLVSSYKTGTNERETCS